MIFRILTFALLATLAWRMVTLADTADGTDAVRSSHRQFLAHG